MEAYRVASTHVFDTILLPFRSVHPLIGLGIVSLLTAVLMLVAFRYASNQEAIRGMKEKIKAHILEITLFKHDPRLVMRAQRRILRYSLLHLRYAVVPFLVMLPPLVIILVQLDLRFGYSPLRPGESAIVTVTMAEQVPWESATVRLAVPEGLEIETPALRVEEEREISWRVKADQYGEFDLTFLTAEQDLQKRLIAANELAKVSPRKVRATLVDLLLSPGEAPLPNDSPIQSIEVGYSPRTINVMGLSLHWLVFFCVLSLAGGYAFKDLLGVEL